MHQAPASLAWRTPPTDGVAIQQQWNYGPAIPSIAPQQAILPAARKQVPARRPVGQAASFSQQPLTRENSASTSRQSVSSISSVPSLNSSVASPMSSGSLTQPQNVQSPPPIIKQLPVGWKICHDPHGRTYFLNTHTNQSSWEPPESEVITPNYGFPQAPAFTPVTYAPMLAPQFLPAQPVQQVQPAGQFSANAFAPQPSQFSPTIIPQEQPQVLSTGTFDPPTVTLQPQQFSPASASTPSFSQSLQWETYEPGCQDSRRKSRFSLPKGFNPPKINTASVKNGAKKASETGLKGAKVAGKALKNNRKVLGVGLKLANVVLNQTTGVTIPGASLLAGGGDDDDDGVLGIVGAVGSMVAGGGEDGGDVDVDVDDSCEIEMEVEEVSVDDDGNMEVEYEEMDIYEDEETVEYVDCQAQPEQPVLITQTQTFQPNYVQQEQPAAMRPENRRKPVVNNTHQQRPPVNGQSATGQKPVKRQKPQQLKQNVNGRRPPQQRPSAAPLQPIQGCQSKPADNLATQRQQTQGSTRQSQLIQAQASRTRTVRSTNNNRSATEPSMQATLQQVSNLACGLGSLFMDDEFQDPDDGQEDEYAEIDEEYYEEDVQYDEEYSNNEVLESGVDAQQDFLYEERVEEPACFGNNVSAYSNEPFPEQEFQVDYSTLDGSGAFCGEQSFTIDDQVEQPTPKEVDEGQRTQISQTMTQESATTEIYMIDSVQTIEVIQQETVIATRDTQIAEANQQETAIQEDFTGKTVRSSDNFQTTSQEEISYGQADFQTSTQNKLGAPSQDVREETLDTWGSVPAAETSLWASENAMLEENVWATETAKPWTREVDAWAQADVHVTGNSAQQSYVQEEAVLAQTKTAQENIYQETIATQTTEYAESMASQSNFESATFAATIATVSGQLQEETFSEQIHTVEDSSVQLATQEELLASEPIIFSEPPTASSGIRIQPSYAQESFSVETDNVDLVAYQSVTEFETFPAAVTSGRTAEIITTPADSEHSRERFSNAGGTYEAFQTQFSFQIETYEAGPADFMEGSIISSATPQDQTQTTIVNSKNDIYQPSQTTEVINIEVDPNSGAAPIGAVPVLPFKNEEVIVITEVTRVQDSSAPVFAIEDIAYTETAISREDVQMDLVSPQEEVVTVQAIQNDPIRSLPSQRKAINTESISFILTPPEETASQQSFIIDDTIYSHTENTTLPISDPEETFIVSPIQTESTVTPTSTPPQVFAIFSGSTEATSDLRNSVTTNPTPEEETPSTTTTTTPTQHHHKNELFFTTRPQTQKPPTETHVTEQLRVFLERQALIFTSASASASSATIPEPETAEESHGSNPVAGISIPPPPPYPPPPRRHHHKLLHPSNPPKPRTAWTIPPPIPPPKVSQDCVPVSEEAETTTEDDVYELSAPPPDEPHIIDPTPDESYAMAMFASGDFLGDDLSWGAVNGNGVVEEEENVLPEVWVG